MENTTKAGTLHLTKTKLLRTLLFIVFAFLVGRTPVTGECFPAAIALIAYMVSKNTLNLYLIFPVAAGIAPYFWRGYDPWGDLIAMGVCGIFFIAARKIRLLLWHRALIAASIGIVCTSIYRLMTATVYKMELEFLLFEGFLIFAMMFLADAFYRVLADGGPGGRQKAAAWELSLAALAVVCLVVVCGAGLSFLLWPMVVFIALWAFAYLETGQALFAAAVAGCSAALMDQQQWGLLMTVLIGLCGAAFCRRFGTLAAAATFMLVCFALRSVESGVVLGIDNYCLFLGTAAFLIINWKFGNGLKKIMLLFAGADGQAREKAEAQAGSLLRARASEMEGLAELYATYLDRRSVLANQFDVTRQIIDDVRRQMNVAAGPSVQLGKDRIDADIAVSQCAASGLINGDCCGWQDIGDGRTAMVISDGMGKGKKAAAESLMVVRTIIALLKSGVSTDLTLKMINTIMLIKDDEDSFATVDLIIIDRRTGKAKFYKIGAAPTLIRRKGNVEEVKLSAVPLGIVNGLKVRYVETVLKREDWIIMMSDGVSDGGAGDGFLTQIRETALRVRSSDPRTMCDLILNQAADSYIGKERDDLTVMVARIV